MLRGLTVRRLQVKYAMIVTLLLPVPSCLGADFDAVVQGRIRDGQGVAQVGVLVQVLTQTATLAGTAYTDKAGYYRVGHLLPGRYQVRATAALFTPATRNNLSLPGGTRTAVDLTLSTIFQSPFWLPAERRRTDEPKDDWRWTLRSSANRPVLRLTDDDAGLVLVSSSNTEKTKPEQHVSAAVVGGGGGFGVGGVHHRLTMDQTMEDASDIVLRVELGSDSGLAGRASSTSFDAGYQRRLGFGGSARTVINFQTHPEMRGTGGAIGLGALRLADAQRFTLGDMIDVEYGSAISVVRVAETGVTVRPFVRMVVHPVEGWSVGYRMATSRDLQAYDGLDSVQWETPVAALAGGKLTQEGGKHQELGVTRNNGESTVQVAFYRDNIENAALSGSGVVPADDLQRPGVQGLLVDAVTDNFRLLSGQYSGSGVRVTVSEPLTRGLFVAFSLATGDALTTRATGAATLSEATTSLRAKAGQSLTVAVKGRIEHTGTRLRAAYRWQPRSMVTAIDPYGPFSDQAFLSFYISQPLHCGGMLPHGVNAVVDATNLLGQGYQNLLLQDGHTVFLAQSPRMIQAGLSYTF